MGDKSKKKKKSKSAKSEPSAANDQLGENPAQGRLSRNISEEKR